MVDHYSGFPFVTKLNTTSTHSIVNALLQWFTDVGLPEVIKSDNGPQFRGPFLKFCKKLGIKHETSSPYHPQSNGLAEAGIETMKTLLSKLYGYVIDPTVQLSTDLTIPSDAACFEDLDVSSLKKFVPELQADSDICFSEFLE
ncbi:uncharacterized protein K02A2.6-like [Tigriopus californicus]|uniref:uncharacterized protein K02A2.6-like n=1 Tax=Tigriopus californicus TaxID=6832 RepID=UPI0027DA7D52|nr:uncharacterized protein K02A2.6-like [Tigriopus californicus]